MWTLKTRKVDEKKCYAKKQSTTDERYLNVMPLENWVGGGGIQLKPKTSLSNCVKFSSNRSENYIMAKFKFI